ncbi:Hypothetical_protein [Hexamita inflata]|uniref:Hypothetical_protein n=1 Tax=Hexamita inflata TaxID=28002 RepID=A0AA86UG85_9EUKA|nr:Hypothetical protein HINF_LOCUS42269 [Hexamita inflata]
MKMHKSELVTHNDISNLFQYTSSSRIATLNSHSDNLLTSKEYLQIFQNDFRTFRFQKRTKISRVELQLKDFQLLILLKVQNIIKILQLYLLLKVIFVVALQCNQVRICGLSIMGACVNKCYIGTYFEKSARQCVCDESQGYIGANFWVCVNCWDVLQIAKDGQCQQCSQTGTVFKAGKCACDELLGYGGANQNF